MKETLFSGKTGLSAGIKYIFPIAPTNLGLFASADFIYNPSRADDVFDEAELEGFDVKRPVTFNIPILVGLNYTYDVDSKIGLWAETGIGVNFRKTTNAEFSYEDQYEKYTFKMGTSAAVKIGAGLMVNEKVSVGLNYYWLGKAKMKATYKYNYYDDYYGFERGTEKGTVRVSANVFMLRLGYHF